MSKELVIGNTYHRQLSIFNPEDCQLPVVILGAGMIGSTSALLLSKLGIEDITVYDGDMIEEHNFPNQMYPKTALGKNKAAALSEIIKEWTYTKMVPIEEYWDNNCLEGIVISAVDSLKTRQKIWEKCKYSMQVDLFIDGRIGGQQVSVYTIDPKDYDDAKFYESTLVKKAADLPCTERGVIDVSFFCASIITRQAREYLVNKKILGRNTVLDASEMRLFMS